MAQDLRRLSCLLAAGVVLGSLLNAVSAAPLKVFDPKGPGAWPVKAPRIGVEELDALLRSKAAVVVLDVRHEKAWRAGNIPGSISMPAQEVVQVLGRPGLAGSLKAASLIVVVCESERCPMGDRTAQVLARIGYPSVKVLHGGWEQWTRRRR